MPLFCILLPLDVNKRWLMTAFECLLGKSLKIHAGLPLALAQSLTAKSKSLASLKLLVVQ